MKNIHWKINKKIYTFPYIIELNAPADPIYRSDFSGLSKENISMSIGIIINAFPHKKTINYRKSIESDKIIIDY